MKFKVAFTILTLYGLFINFIKAVNSCSSSQAFNTATKTCVNSCPRYTYTQTDNGVNYCYPQTPVSAYTRMSPQTLMYILIFETTLSSAISSTSEAYNVLTFSLQSNAEAIIIPASALYLNFIDTKHEMLEFVLPSSYMASSFTLLLVNFKDTSYDDSKKFYFKQPALAVNLQPYQDFSSSQESLLNTLTNLDFYLEISWTAIALLTYHPIMYLNAKTYRENMDMFKMVNITYSPFLEEFFKRNSNKVAGIKVPNLPSILLYKEELTSGWNRDMTVDQLIEFNPTRNPDIRVLASQKVLEFNSFPFFFDSYGIELTLIAGIPVLIGLIELAVLFISQEKEGKLFFRAIMALRSFLRWNLLISTIIGSLPTLIFYGMLQLQVLYHYPKNKHNVPNAAVAVGMLVFCIFVLPLFLYRATEDILRLKKRIPNINYKETLRLSFWRVLHEPYRDARKIFTSFVFIGMLRSLIFAVVVLFLTNIPTLQITLMLVASIATLVLMIVFKPYEKLSENILHLGYEAIQILMLVGLLLLASSPKKSLINSSFINKTNYVVLSAWIAQPLWTITFRCCMLLLMIIQRLTRKGKSANNFEVNPNRFTAKIAPSRASQSEVVYAIKRNKRPNADLMLSSKLETEAVTPGLKDDNDLQTLQTTERAEETDGLKPLNSRKRVLN